MTVRLIERVDDLLNPIVVKELRQAVQSRIVMAVLLLFLLIEVTTLGVYLAFQHPTEAPATINFRAGVDIFLWLQGFLLFTCILAIPIYAGVRLAAERSDTNVDLLFITTLKPGAIVWGKLVSAVVLILLIFCACAPFMMFTYLLRGIDIPTIALVLGIDFLAVLLGTQGAIFVAAIPATRPFRILLGLVALFGLLQLLYISLAGTVTIVELGVGSTMDSARFWGPASGVLALVLGGIGLLFTWSIAIVSPPAANRAVAMRLFVLLFSLATFAAALVWMREIKEPYPVLMWMCLSAGLSWLQLVISINEREQWGGRIRRTIPRRLVLRLPAFLLYSGSGGGVVFSLGMLVFTLYAGWLTLDLVPAGILSPTREPRLLAILLTLSLYGVAYCLSAVLLRRMIGSKRIPAMYTWFIAAIMLGMGSIVPYLIYWAVATYFRLYGRIEIEWVITNPFAAAAEMETLVGKPDFQWYKASPLIFSGVWATLALLGSLPWIVRQLLAFQPPSSVPYAVLAESNGQAAEPSLAGPAVRQEQS